MSSSDVLKLIQILKHALPNVGARPNRGQNILPATSMRACRKRAYTTLEVSSNTPKPLKMQEVTRYRMTTHPVEYDMYYSV